MQVGAGLDTIATRTGGGGGLATETDGSGTPCPLSPRPPSVDATWQGPPKVALMFLTRGDMPYEALWRAFLGGASEVVEAAAAAAAAEVATRESEQQGDQGQPGSARSSSSGGSSTATLWQQLFGGGRPPDSSAWQRLFSLYTHPSPGWSHPRSSLFAGHEVPCRHTVEWGNHSVVDAERALLRAALRDPANQRFALLSESCLPLHPATVVYAQLMAEPRSRVNACR